MGLKICIGKHTEIVKMLRRIHRMGGLHEISQNIADAWDLNGGT